MRFNNLHITAIILILIISNNAILFSQNILKQTDSITNNTIEKYKIFCGLTSTSLPIEGTIPSTTSLTFQFRWIKTIDTLTNSWNFTSPTDTFPNYQPPNPGLIPAYYKRIVISNGEHDTSNVCVVKYIPGSQSLTTNFVSPSVQNVHIGDLPNSFNGPAVTGGTLTDSIKYIWLKSQDINFSIPIPALEGSYQAQNLSFSQIADSNFYYDRFAYIQLPTSEIACVLPSNPVQIYLLDSNVITCVDTVICGGTVATEIIGNQENTYSYQWQLFNGTIWVDINNENNYEYYPGLLDTTTKFRRVVNFNGFTLISNVITIHVFKIFSNTIWNNSTNVCAGQSGAVILGLNPNGSDSLQTFQYSWYFSNNQTNWILNNSSSTINYFSSTVIYNTMYFVRIIRSGICKDTSNIVTVNPIIIDAVAASPILACGDTIMLVADQLLVGEEGLWISPSQISVSNINLPNTLAVLTVPLSATPYSNTLHWIVKNSGCSDTAHVTVTFFHDINPAYAGTDITLIGQDSVQLNALPPQYGTGYWSVVAGGGTFIYDNDAHTFAHSIPQGENIYRWTVTNGPCIPKYDDVIVVVTNVKIPEGFSPNNDGLNDFFEIKGIEFYPKAELIVFNRWGTEVYRKIGYDNVWDGKSNANSILPQDTYFYVLKLNDKNSRKGYIILKR